MAPFVFLRYHIENMVAVLSISNCQKSLIVMFFKVYK